MTRLKKLLITMLLSLIALGFTISVYGTGFNSFSSKLDENVTKSLDKILEIVKSKKSSLSEYSYGKYVVGITNRLGYLYEGMIEISSPYSNGSTGLPKGGNNTYPPVSSGPNCSVDQPPIYPNQTGPVVINERGLKCGLCSPYAPGFVRNGILYNAGLSRLSSKPIDNKTIFGSVAEYDMIADGYGWPGGEGSSIFMNIKKDKYLALKFNTDEKDFDFIGGDSGGFRSGIQAINTGGNSTLQTFSISECPGDFNVHLNNPKCLSEGVLKWSTNPNANDKYANSPNPDARNPYCILDKNKDYYFNIIHSKISPDGSITSGCKTSSCGALSQQVLSGGGTRQYSFPGNNGYMRPDNPRRTGRIGKKWSQEEKDTINSKTISWPITSLDTHVKAFKYVALEFNSGNNKTSGVIDAFSDTYNHPDGYQIAPGSHIGISKIPGDFTSTCSGLFADRGLAWTVGYTSSEMFPGKFEDNLFNTKTCILEKNQTYYLNIMQGGMSNNYSNCESSSGECSVTIKNEYLPEKK